MKKDFQISLGLENKLSEIFEDIIIEGGLIAVGDVLQVLQFSIRKVGDSAIKDGNKIKNKELIYWGRSLRKTAHKLEKISQSITWRGMGLIL